MKTIFLALILFWCCSALCVAQNMVTPNKAELVTNALKSVADLETYIKVMLNKNNPMEIRNANMQLAIQLFSSGTNTVAVTSLNNPSKKQYRRVQQYFVSVKDLPYKSVQITEIHLYVSKNYVLGKDGRYYGDKIFCLNYKIGADGKLSLDKKEGNCIGKTYQSIIEKLDCVNGKELQTCYILKLGDIKVDEQR